MSPIVSYQYPNDLGSEALTNGGVNSPVVSYQFFNSLSESGTTIVSPIVSYQYFDWPGDDVVQLLSSPHVSYFYQIGSETAPIVLSGQVSRTDGGALSGATVSASVLSAPGVSATTGGDGNFALPALSPGVYALAVSRPGFVTDRRVVTLSAGTARQDFRLRPVPTAPQTQTVTAPPPFSPPPQGGEGSALRLFDGTSFVTIVAPLDRAKMTVVVTHGWIPPFSSGVPLPLEGGWPKNLALALQAKGVNTVANILAWDWALAAIAALPPEEKTPDQGLALGKALYQALGFDYAQRVHFIGHSLGALVNAAAADYLHGHARGSQESAQPAWLSSRTHLTLTDEAELARVAGREVLFGTTLAAFTGLPVQRVNSALTDADYKSPIPMNPAGCAWIENYVSAFGLYHPEAVNVCLQKAAERFPNPVTMHSYSAEWYRKSVERVGASLMGFTNSFERTTLFPGQSFPPAGAPYRAGNVFRQATTSPDWLVVEPVNCGSCPECSFPYLELLENRVEATVDHAVASTVGAIKSAGDVVVDFGERTVVNIAEGANYLVDQASQAGQQVVDLANGVWLRVRLRTGRGGGGSWRAKDEGGTSTNTPAYAWLPIAVPADAVVMVFDFTISGDGVEDALAFGINGTNLFSVGTKFIPTNQFTTSRLIDVSACAGTTNEFFFGVLGGTSTNCAAQIEGIRFYTLNAPELVIAQSSGVTRLSWPSSANGYALETAVNLSGDPWNAVTNTPALFGGRFTVTNQWPDQTRFFRLRAR
ncbi:MAG: carboxypeptidase regulatory-like domain-containing protein [Verrucomicrobia bacterium]|nr:carboxypeptidase regulatory-like domain-containing protein [Verrucomicrobiota bacterium]